MKKGWGPHGVAALASTSWSTLMAGMMKIVREDQTGELCMEFDKDYCKPQVRWAHELYCQLNQ